MFKFKIKKLIYSNKAISPVVATALLLVIAVTAVVGFQGWFTTFSSGVFVDVETQTSSSNSVTVEGLVGEKLYVNSAGNSSINSIKINDVDCNFNGSVSGLDSVNISSCLDNVSGSANIVVVTDDGIFESYKFVDNELKGGQGDTQITETNLVEHNLNLGKLFSKNSFSFNGKNYLFYYNDSIKAGVYEVLTSPPSLNLVDYIPTSIIGYVMVSSITEFNNKIYFISKNGSSKQELFSFDGTTISFDQDYYPGASESGYFGSLTPYNGDLYFAGNSATFGNELYKTTTSLVTTNIADIVSGVGDSLTGDLIVFNNKVVFSARNGSQGFEVWESDGVTTNLVQDIRPGDSFTRPYEYTELNGKLYFIHNDGSTGQELFEYDGSTITRVTDFRSGSLNTFTSSNSQIFKIGNELFIFRVEDGSTDYNVGKFNGTTFSMVSTFDGYLNVGDQVGMYQFGDKLYITQKYWSPQGGGIGPKIYEFNPINDSINLIFEGSDTHNELNIFQVGTDVFFDSYELIAS